MLLTLCKSDLLHYPCCGAAGLLASGIIPTVQHCLSNLLTTDARVIPASATVYAQVSMQSRGLCSVNDAQAVALLHLWRDGNSSMQLQTQLPELLCTITERPCSVVHPLNVLVLVLCIAGVLTLCAC